MGDGGEEQKSMSHVVVEPVSEAKSARDHRRYGKSDDELTGWFSAAIGCKAQSYDSDGGGTDPNEQHYARLRSMARGTMRWFDRVGDTVRLLPLAERRVLVLVYTPHSWPTWLQDALTTPWGGGNFVALAATTPRAANAAGKAGATSVHHWLVSRGRGGANERESKEMRDLFRRLKDDCEALRVPALAAYEALRVDRVKREQAAERQAKSLREAKNAALLEEHLGVCRRRARAKLDRRIRLAAKGRAA